MMKSKTSRQLRTSHTPELKKVLGVAFGIALVVGNVLVAGILRNTGTIAHYLQNYWLIIGCWVINRKKSGNS